MIDADAFIAAYCKECGSGCDLGEIRCVTVGDLVNAPTIDAVPVVRCKDCKTYSRGTCWIMRGKMNPEDFCSYGERRSDD